MKQFLYCESQEGGMDHQIVSNLKQLQLRSWMDSDCRVEDQKLKSWSLKAQAGEYYTHRLGICIRLKDI